MDEKTMGHSRMEDKKGKTCQVHEQWSSQTSLRNPV